MIVIKFGGSSLANTERIKHAVEIIKMYREKKPLLVLSAFGKTTDNLLEAGQKALEGDIDISKIETLHIQICKELEIDDKPVWNLLEELASLLCGISMLKELNPRTDDYLVSFGERLAVRVVAQYLNHINMPSKYFDAWDIGFITDSQFKFAELLPETYQNVANTFAPLKNNYDYIPVITGFIARDKNKNITTLGRGGTDLTASVVGASLEVEEIQVWKDVDGILTTDPRIVKNAYPVESISFEQASELAYFGAKVLHPRSITPAMQKNIPVIVKNSYNPTHPGTKITNIIPEDESWVKSITYKKNVTLIHIVSTRMLGQYGFLAKVFHIFAELHISVDVITTSEVSVALTLENDNNLDQLKSELEKIANVTIHQGKTIVSLIGDIKHSVNILGKTMDILKKNKIQVQMISHGASKVNNSFIIDDQDANTLITELHRLFFEKNKKLI
jgi:aspartate kinase